MLTIKNQQLEQINDIKFQEFVASCQKLIEDEHPEVFKTLPVNDWQPFILRKIKAARHFGIHEPKNTYMFMLTLAESPQYFKPVMPLWATDILNWPGRTEDDKIVQLCKEVYKLNELPINKKQ